MGDTAYMALFAANLTFIVTSRQNRQWCAVGSADNPLVCQTTVV